MGYIIKGDHFHKMVTRDDNIIEMNKIGISSRNLLPSFGNANDLSGITVEVKQQQQPDPGKVDIKKENDIIVQNEGSLYCVAGQNWDEYINDDQLYQKLKASIGNAKTINTDQLDGLNPPIDSQELWASGVTYYMSKKGREEESKETGGSIFYTKVYDADRPELFFKATKNRISGAGEAVRIRRDSSWNVPEPELTLFATSNAKIVGYSIGNDMSSRDIEGENSHSDEDHGVSEVSEAGNGGGG